MKNIKKLQKLGTLRTVRLRMGADHENDNRYDDIINSLSNQELVEKWAGWHLGDEGWARKIISQYKILNDFDKKQEK